MRRPTVLGTAALLALAAPAAAQTPPHPAAATLADLAVKARADALIPLLAGAGDYDALFAPSFRAAVPATRLRAIAEELTATLGRPLRVDTIAAPSRWRAELTIAFERGTATARLALDPADPHAIIGLLITGTRPDAPGTLADIERDLRALPGSAALGLYRLGGTEPEPLLPQPLLEVNADRPIPIGSAFKLWVLAETARQVAAGTRRWADVLPVGPASLPSGVLQTWPARSPVTLQTLATLAISISDNTAADTLVRALGRASLDRFAAANGLSAPVLTTREAFVLKGDVSLRARWSALPFAGKAALLARDAARFDVTPLATGVFANGPVATDTAEWFASPRATARLLDRLRTQGGDTARAILAINPGIDRATADRFAYVGYKGGSEPGVLSLDYLVRTRGGTWYAVAAAWHRPDGEVSEVQLGALTARALRLLADR